MFNREQSIEIISTKLIILSIANAGEECLMALEVS